jgi:UDP-N-acetylglucosamine--N-acetylmuramyl-(pentapeptide) pyrophosphoryl-undecaprenol N-acetylglucosamine transferase
MPLAEAVADLAVTRAGATTVAELTARGLPAILVPWAGAADNHQEANARALERLGAAEVLLDEELSGSRLAEAIDALVARPDRLQSMAQASRTAGVPDSATRVVRELALLATGTTAGRAPFGG